MTEPEASPTVRSAFEKETEARLAAAGIVVPADLKAGVMTEIRDILAMAALLRKARPPSAEPFGALWPSDRA